uniref:Uncharacterized protein n=1 Tax=Salmo trutta TaxID=8032 RepID=A0A674BCM8_SALTR
MILTGQADPNPQRNRQLLFSKVTEKSLEKMPGTYFMNNTFGHTSQNIHKQLRQYLQRTLQGGATVQTGSAEQAAKNSQDPAWLLRGVPEQDLCSFVMPYYLKQEQENAVLAQRVQAGREGINQTEQRIATAVEGECNRRHCASLAASLPPSTCL